MGFQARLSNTKQTKRQEFNIGTRQGKQYVARIEKGKNSKDRSRGRSLRKLMKLKSKPLLLSPVPHCTCIILDLFLKEDPTDYITLQSHKNRISSIKR